MRSASVFILLIAMACGCSRQEKFVEQRMQMATVVEIQVLAPPSDEAGARKAMDAAFKAIAAVERELSWFEKSNDLARIRSAQPGDILKLTDWTWGSLKLARSITAETDGIYDVCAGPVIRLWGFGPDKKRRVPTEEQIQEALRRTGADKLVLLDSQQAVSTVVAGVEVDLSSLAAGFAVDRAAEALFACGYSNFLVNGGGEIRMSSTGSKTWRIGIQVPSEDAAIDDFFPNRVIKLGNGCVSTSGSYRNFFAAGTNAYAHIVNPHTGRPVQSDTVSVTTWATNCTLADAWSTALFALPVDKALALADRLPEIECLIVQVPEKGSKKFRFLESRDFAKKTR